MVGSMGNAHLASVIWNELGLKKYDLFNGMFRLGIKLSLKIQGINVCRLKSDYFCLFKNM